MKKRTRKAATRVFLLFAALLLLLVLSLFYLTLRQGLRYNQVVAEYEASSLSARMTELYLSGESIILNDFGEAAAGFGVYDGNGVPVLRLGSAPEEITDLHPGNTGEALFRDDGSLLVLRASGRGRRQQGSASSVPATRDRVITLLVYNDRRTRGTVTVMVLLTGLLFAAFVGLIAGIARLYRRIDRIKAEEGENRQLIRLGQAARILTHEIKNPLGSIRIQEKILAKKLPEEYRPSLTIIGEETARIARLTDRVGDFLKHPQGTPAKVNLTAALEEVVTSYAGSIQVHANFTGPAEVRIDPDNLRSVLENVIGNALDMGTEEGVSVTLSPSKGGFTLEVADTGPGIDPASADRIFDLFYTTRTTGSGIGLAVAKSFIEAAGGSITAANRNGGGAVFTIYLPECRDT